MIGKRLIAVAGLFALAACGGPAAKDEAADAGPAVASPAQYYTKISMNEFMVHVMQYAGDGIWKRQGWITDKDGQRSLFPDTDEEWIEAESAALALAEITNVLLIPGRRVPEANWDKSVADVRAIAIEAAAAAEKKDADAWFAAGGKLDGACEGCHLVYDPVTPQDVGEPTAG